MGDIHEGRNAQEKLKPINLLKGWPNPSLLPTNALKAASQTALSIAEIWTPGLAYGPDPGYQPLREEIARWLSKFYSPSLDIATSTSNASTTVNSSENSLSPDPDRICISGGASQNLACILQVYSDPVTTTVWMVAPCYYLACRVFEDSGLRLKAVPEGKDGIDLEWLEKGLKETERDVGGLKPFKVPRPGAKLYKHIIYLVPTFSNPSGKTMPTSSREDLVRLARRYDALIVSDDVYDFLQWRTAVSSGQTPPRHAPVPRLVDIDRTLAPIPGKHSFGNAVSNGSFSKIVAPGVRTGWAEGTPKFTYGLSQCGSSRSGGAPSQLVATFLSEMLKDGILQNHIQLVLCPSYQKRYKLMYDAIQEHLLPLGLKLGETSFGAENLFGGYFVWLELPDGLAAPEILEEAKMEELIVSGGNVFEVHEDQFFKFNNNIRLCFSWEQEENLAEGVARLSTVIKRLLQRKKPTLNPNQP